jgi:hypothetical protein
MNEQAENWSASGLKALRKLEQPNTVLEKLSSARIVFKSMLEIGGLVAEVRAKLGPATLLLTHAYACFG